MLTRPGRRRGGRRDQRERRPDGLWDGGARELADGTALKRSATFVACGPGGGDRLANRRVRTTPNGRGESSATEIQLTPDDHTPIIVPRSDLAAKGGEPHVPQNLCRTKTARPGYGHRVRPGLLRIASEWQKGGRSRVDPIFTPTIAACCTPPTTLTEQMTQGANAVGRAAGQRLLYTFARDAWYFEKTPWRDDPVLARKLRLEYCRWHERDRGDRRELAGQHWSVVHDGIKHGEEYDARREMPGWDTATFDDAQWAKRRLWPARKGVLSAEMTARIALMQTITPVSVVEPKPGVFVFDMGQNFAGWAQVKVSGPAGTTVRLRLRRTPSTTTAA